MSVDLKQFRQVFIEESFEGLDIMEKALMALNAEAIESETINAIFRAAHSIKGGSATFGFSAIAGFTHVLETLLDQIRSGKRGMSTADIDLFLQSVDAMREMLTLLQQEQNSYTESALSLKSAFEGILNLEAKASGINKPLVTEKPDNQLTGTAGQASDYKIWHIQFIPNEDILRTGNCPLRILAELAKLGNLKVTAQPTAPIQLSAMDVESCYLQWQIDLVSGCDEADIWELFDWVRDESQISFTVSSDLERWSLQFKPQPHLLHTGNDPVRILKIVTELPGRIEVTADCTAVPALKLLDPENIHISWTLLLDTNVAAEQILASFDWVKDDAEILLTKEAGEGFADLSPAAVEVEPTQFNPVSETSSINTHIEKSLNRQDAPKKATASEASSIRVGIDKIDSLINMVGELVITQSMLGQLSNELDSHQVPKLMEGLNQLAQNTRELQESVMRIRMLPISFTFSRFPRMVRDLSLQLGKKIHLELSGENTELDKTVMEKIGDPLVHLVRNAVDHGIELPEERLAAGKPAEGTIILNAYHQSGNVIIEIIDDGKGLDRDRILAKALEKNLISSLEAQTFNDEQIYDLIFQPGFSTAQTVSDVSGRGVGMDVVKRNIQALNGVVEIQSRSGKGSKILIRLPLTLAILDGQLVRVNHHIYIFPLVAIVESMQYKIDKVSNIAGGCSVFKLREDFVPIVHLKDIFNIPTVVHHEDEQPLMVVVESDGEKVGVVVDELLAQQQVVIKSLEQNYRKVEGVSGATILGDGTVALILDIQGLVKIAGVRQVENLALFDSPQNGRAVVTQSIIH